MTSDRDFRDRMLLRRSRRGGVCAWDDGACACIGPKCPRRVKLTINGVEHEGTVSIDGRLMLIIDDPIKLPEGIDKYAPVSYSSRFTAKGITMTDVEFAELKVEDGPE